MKICRIEGCERKHKAMGMCDTHYSHYKRTGRLDGRRVKPLSERLWARVGQGSPDDCWEWRGYVHPTGYGQIGYDHKKGNVIHTHRAAWIVTHGEIEDGLWVLHKCDNRLCCNPDHLWLGTPKDNTQDMMSKGRRRKAVQVVRGVDVRQAKLTDETVRAMRAEPPMTFKALGAKYGVSAATANKVILRRTWDHVD